jgi:hypothetical protein
MKIRSLLLGSVAAAGLSTGAYAADLGVLTSLDVCDALGLSGLTISSDTNCLQITGSVSYEFKWGDYEAGGPPPVELTLATAEAGAITIIQPGAAVGGGDFDWYSKVEAWIQFAASADSDFGPAKAVIKLKGIQEIDGWGTAGNGSVVTGGDDTDGVILDEAWVAVGDSTVIMAGDKGSLINFEDDVPLNFLGLFNSDEVDKGVKWNAEIGDGGHVIQITSDLGNGVSLSGGLENLAGTNTTTAGTVFGVLAYAGDGIAAHISVAGAGWLDGTIENWGFHARVTGSFDMIKFVAALAGDNGTYLNGLASVSATFDIFTLAVSGEFAGFAGAYDVGAGGSISANVTDGIAINLGGRFYADAAGDDVAQGAAQLVAAVTESITLTGEVGVYTATTAGTFFYGAAELLWAPGGGFTSSVKGEGYSNGAYRATFKAAKTFE